MKKYLLCLLTTIVFLCAHTILFAQQKQIRGKVVDADGKGIPSATVQLAGTQTATTTDDQGNFIVRAVKGQQLEITSVGYQKYSFLIGKSTEVQISLTATDKELNEVVVTALGIKREKRSLGYAVQEIKGDQLGCIPNCRN